MKKEYLLYLKIVTYLFAFGLLYVISHKGEVDQEVIGKTVCVKNEDIKVYKRVAITFDDGPHSVYTEQLLDGLKERIVVATFFVVGSNISGNEELIKRMSDEGHLIGNHTYTHVELEKISEQEQKEEILKTNEMITNITGKSVEFIRPPFGSYNRDRNTFGMYVVLWDVDPRDWCIYDVNQVVESVVNEVEDGDIILFHDIFESSVEAALKVIDELKSRGYEFVTVEEILL